MSPEGPNSLTCLDTSVLDDLFPPGDPKTAESFSDFLKIFDHSCAHSLQKLTAAVSAADFPEILAAAHNSKGAAGNIGSARTAEICRKIETAGKSNSLEEIQRLNLELQKEIVSVRKALEDYGRRLARPSSKN